MNNKEWTGCIIPREDGPHFVRQFGILKPLGKPTFDPDKPLDPTETAGYRFDLDITEVKKVFDCENNKQLAAVVYQLVDQQKYSMVRRYDAYTLFLGWELYLAMFYDPERINGRDYVQYLLDRYNVVVDPESETRLDLACGDQEQAAHQAMEKHVLGQHERYTDKTAK